MEPTAEGELPPPRVESIHQYRGDLSQVALPEILYTIDRFQVPGVIEASRGGVVKRVYIRDGNVVHAASTDLEDSLGTYLQRTGAISPSEYAETMAERQRTQKRYGVLLLERRILSPAQLYRAIREQIENIVWSLFSWTEGDVVFRIGGFRDAEAVRLQLPMRQVILQGIKRAPEAKPIVSRLGKKETVFEPSFQVEDLIDTAMDGPEFKLLGLVDGRRTLYELCTIGPLGVAENGKLIYAFHVLQLIRRVDAPTPPPQTPIDGGSGAIRIRFKSAGTPHS